MSSAINESFSYQIGKTWSHSIELMRLLKKEDDLYLDELYLLSTIQEVFIETGKPCNQQRLVERFNILSYKRDKMLDNLVKRGYVNNDMEGPRQHYKPFKLVLTSKGDQLLIKYKKAMERLCNGD
jgi:predicted transcriptional regulator